MNLAGIKNIIFDLGGVLLNINYQLTQQAFENLGVINFDHYYTKAQQNGLFNLFETGKISEAVFCLQLQELTQLDATPQEIITAWNTMLLDFPAIRKELLLKVKASFNTSLLSNTNETHIRQFNKIIQHDINEASLSPLFNTHYFSNEIGLRKPDREAFEYVLKENNYLASETLFLDDSIQHIEGAKKCGIYAFHVQETPVEVLFANFLT